MDFFKTFSEWTVSDFASFIGGIVILIYVCAEVFKKATEHTEWARKKKDARAAAKREIAHQQYKEFTDEFIKEFVPPLIKQFEKTDQEIIDSLNKLSNSTNDILRKEMTDIYYRYLPYKKILQYDKKCFVRLFHDYGAQGGNSYIQELWDEIQTWEVVLTEGDLHW